MSPTQFHAKKEITHSNNNGAMHPPPLKINRDSHFIKKSLSPPPPSCSTSSSSSSSSIVNGVMAAGSTKPQQRHPVIIYTHSPKVIHTHPRDFMALVQKLTGLSRSDEDDDNNNSKNKPPKPKSKAETANVMSGDKVSTENGKMVGNEDNESSSVVTDENNCSSIYSGDGQVNSCFMTPPIFEPPTSNLYMTNIPVFTPSSADFLCSNQQFLNYTDSLFFSHNMRTSVSSSASLEGMNDLREY
ncbi:putative VQ motif-containing protein [Quillaja saponaria]|uniref:VQ motif-containing protein n=1 Tax=Quillaja saponaria TaxID=32244 RepID=A0AAD7Q583_QUISA|nr:putative VQ motif-containing protein [Quillaja saponaria]